MKQYFSYFKFWFIILGIMAVLTGVVSIMNNMGSYSRKNSEAPSRRVYDYADVLSDSEENKLEKLIAKREVKIGCDIVLVTIDESLYEKYGYTEDTDENWEDCMMNFADDFYDENNYGFNRVHGDGVLLLDNWYQGEKGSWLSTCGRVYEHYTYYMIDDVLDAVYAKVESSPYQAYRAYIETVYKEMSGKTAKIELKILPLFLISFVAAAIFIMLHLKTKAGTKTTAMSTYVENGSIRFNVKRDDLVNKFVTSRVIPRNTGGSSGGSSRSGGSGGHRSSGGVSHGGGGRRR